jgi:hypothetical protein
MASYTPPTYFQGIIYNPNNFSQIGTAGNTGNTGPIGPQGIQGI